MESEMKIPEFLNTEEKYNKMIRETDTLEKFEQIFLILLDVDGLEMPNVLKLMKIIQRDVNLVHQLTHVSALMEMTESFIKYMEMREIETSKKVEQEEEEKKEVKRPKTMKRLVRDNPKFPKHKHNNNNNKTTPEEGIWECDC